MALTKGDRMTDDTIRSAEEGGPVSAYQGLVYNIFQLPRDSQHGAAIAVTSPTRGTGTSYLVRALANELGSHPSYRILRVDLGVLARTLHSAEQALELVTATEQPSIFTIGDPIASSPLSRSASFWHASAEHRRECVDLLRENFQYILFDCPALRESGDTLGIAALVDGLLLIVEADKTTKAEILQAERQIEGAGGRLYGSILNKRKYLVPDWARRRL